MQRRNGGLVFLLMALLLTTGLPQVLGQSIFGTLTGVVSDPAQALVPNAKVTLKNQSSGDVRRTITNTEGYFTLAAIPVGTYELTVEAQGFTTYKVSDLAIQGAEKRNVDVVLKVGSTEQSVTVIAQTDQLVPVDTGEKSATLTTRQLQDFSVVGRSAAEFIKIMPGFAIANTGTENRSNFSGEVLGINGNGEGGSQSALNNAFNVNGLPGSSLDITADGSHVSDPGCNCATPVNPNTDMIQEFKVLTSNFSAENQKGPAVVSSVAKAGTREFHGGAYLYARHHALNSNDWLNNRSGQRLPENKYFFPGGNIGGPVLFPGTNFNRKRDKLFFFTGYEYYFQTIDTGLLRATVPTEGMRQGNFSPAELSKIEGIVNGRPVTSSGGPAQRLNATQFPTGVIPPSQIDRGGQALMNLLPLPNADPNQTGGFNFARQIVFDQNSQQWLSRVDYSISDNTKLFVRYNLQRETQVFPVGLWWRNANQVPYPTNILGKNRSDSVTTSLTHVFDPTMTNEVVFGYTYITFPNSFEDPAKVDRSAVGYPYKGLFKNGVAQIPAFTGWGGEIATLLNPGGFEAGGSRGLFADKHLPTIANNLTKVWATHTTKFGFFWEYIVNNQPANGWTNGLIVLNNTHGGSSGSAYGDLLLGRPGEYSEQSFNRLNNIGYNTVEFFVQDNWKVTRRLSLDLGFRASHFQPWQDREGFGYSVFDYSKFNPNAPPTEYSGFLWNKRDPSVPIGGFPTKALNWAPRAGLAFDIFGNARTVIRGGWGRFYFHTAQFTDGLDVSAGVRARTVPSVTTLPAIEGTDPGVGQALGARAVDRNSDRSPYSDSYSVTVAQRTPWAGLLEVAYVGNRSRNLLNRDNAGANINVVPYGALFQPGLDPNGANVDQFRPLRGFQDLNVITHGLYSNYNSMQITWTRTRGRYNMAFNYALGKSLGIVTNGDLFNLRNNYGALPFDRRHVFNAAYSVELPDVVKPKLAGAFINGWQISGITQIQSGQNLATIQNSFSNDVTVDSNYSFTVNGIRALPNSRTVNGTPNLAWRPLQTCSLSGGLADRQYVNGSCLGLPTGPGQNGPIVGPPVYGPAFFNWDLGLFKNFRITEKQKVQLRLNAYNFPNHPLWSFVGGSPNLKPNFDAGGRMINPVFGTTTEKQGRRIVQLAVKYYF